MHVLLLHRFHLDKVPEPLLLHEELWACYFALAWQALWLYNNYQYKGAMPVAFIHACRQCLHYTECNCHDIVGLPLRTTPELAQICLKRRHIIAQ